MRFLSYAMITFVIVAIFGCNEDKRLSTADLLSTPQWTHDDEYELLLRTESESDGRLLLAQMPYRGEIAPVVYRFTRGSTVLQVVDVSAWEAAQGKVTKLDGYPMGPFAYDYDTDSLTFNRNPVTTKGRTVDKVQASPTGEFVAVESVAGKRGFGIVGFGRGGVHGRQYHQLFRTADGAPVGAPVILPFDEQSGSWGPHWSADGRFVVYPKLFFRFVCIFPVDSIH